MIYTSPVQYPKDLLDPKLKLTAHLFQEQVPKAFEARAVVIKETVFAVRIDAASEAARADWRSDYDALTYTVIELPAEVSAKLVDLHQRLARNRAGTPSGRADVSPGQRARQGQQS